jgi:serine/threonine protein phosphatase PrpC
VEATPPAINVLVSAKTDVGRTRQTNEDSCSITELATGDVIDALDRDRKIDVGARGVLLALSDGMGGHQAGEVASALVLESLQAELRREANKPIERQLEEAIRRANAQVRAAAQTADREGMGATLVAVFIRGTQAYIAEVGDSRGYLLRAGRLRQMTRDQSLVQLLVDQGVMTPSEARRAPGKNVILQAVGLESDVRVAIGRLELRRGDRLLLCSDGVTNEVSDDELRQMMTDCAPRAACETMIALANERGGNDNQTVIVADVLGEDLAEPVEFETVTSTFEVLQAFQANRKRAGTAPAVPKAKPQPQPPPRPEPQVDPEELEVQLEISADEEIAEIVEVEPEKTPPPPPSERQGWIASLLGRRGRKP